MTPLIADVVNVLLDKGEPITVTYKRFSGTTTGVLKELRQLEPATFYSMVTLNVLEGGNHWNTVAAYTLEDHATIKQVDGQWHLTIDGTQEAIKS